MMLDMNQSFNVHTAHSKTPLQVAPTDPVEFDATGLTFQHGNTIRMIPWSEITGIVQVVQPQDQDKHRPGDPR